jgi:hypothetical protein
MYMTMIIPRRVKWKIGRMGRVKYWEVIADNLKKAGWSCGYVATVDYEGQAIWTVDAHRDNGKRYIVRAYELLTAFRELERAVHQS